MKWHIILIRISLSYKTLWYYLYCASIITCWWNWSCFLLPNWNIRTKCPLVRAIWFKSKLGLRFDGLRFSSSSHLFNFCYSPLMLNWVEITKKISFYLGWWFVMLFGGLEIKFNLRLYLQVWIGFKIYIYPAWLLRTGEGWWYLLVVKERTPPSISKQR